MNKTLQGVLLVTALAAAGCVQSNAQTTATLFVSYDAALQGEVLYLTTRVPDKVVTGQLRLLRVQAGESMKALAEAEKAGLPMGTQATAATLAISMYAVATSAALGGH